MVEGFRAAIAEARCVLLILRLVITILKSSVPVAGDAGAPSRNRRRCRNGLAAEAAMGEGRNLKTPLTVVRFIFHIRCIAG